MYLSDKGAAGILVDSIGVHNATKMDITQISKKDAAAGNLNDLMLQKHAYHYGQRLVFIKKVPVEVCGHPAYVYLCIDGDMYFM